MRTQLLAGFFAFVCLSAPAAAEQISATTIRVAVLGSDAREANFSCTVESNGTTLGTFATLSGSLTVPQRLTHIAITCSAQGYQPVKIIMSGDQFLPPQIAPRFMAKAI